MVKQFRWQQKTAFVPFHSFSLTFQIIRGFGELGKRVSEKIVHAYRKRSRPVQLLSAANVKCLGRGDALRP
jgi:hypothetical protein